ncbi:MAG TPA: hypothetical protein VN153_07605, partial [Tahibacter sp.]|nr:hypothetical protein [Tahibacter sp.]
MSMIESIVIVAATVLLHAGVFLAVAWLLERGGIVRSFAAREYLWRSAVVGSLASALLQLVLVPVALPGLRVTVAAASSSDRAQPVSAAALRESAGFAASRESGSAQDSAARVASLGTAALMAASPAATSPADDAALATAAA